MATYLYVRHKVKDFTEWKRGYDAHGSKREEARLTEKHLLRNSSDPNEVFLMFEAGDTLEEVWEHHREHNYSRYPVYDEVPDKIIGIFYIKDLLYFLVDPAGKSFSLREMMRTDPFVVPETKNVREILTELKTRQVGVAIVIDEFGGVAGMVALEDVLEEMVGEIYDEYDEPEQQFIEEKPGRFRIKAQYLLTDLQEHLNDTVLFPLERGYDTVGGLLMDLAGRVPQQGEVFTWPKTIDESDDDNKPTKPLLYFTVLYATETTIDTVRMEIIQPRTPETEGASESSPT